jgi:hypothetical protein
MTMSLKRRYAGDASEVLAFSLRNFFKVTPYGAMICGFVAEVAL